MEDARKAIAQAEAKAAEYADQLRLARADVYKIREQRIKQWSAERDAALDAARKAASEKVRQAQGRARRRSRLCPQGDSGLGRRSGRPGRPRRSAAAARCRGFPLKYSLPHVRSPPFSLLGFPVCRIDGRGRRVDRCPGLCAHPRRRATDCYAAERVTSAPASGSAAAGVLPPSANSEKTEDSEEQAFLHAPMVHVGCPHPAPRRGNHDRHHAGN